MSSKPNVSATEIAEFDVVVVGAGAAGLMAAARAAERGRRTLLLEKNQRPGVKILMSGGTRCNITQATDNRGIVAAYGPPGRFLHSALASFSVDDTVAFFNTAGVPTKVEPTGKIFPVSNKAADVLAALLSHAKGCGAKMATSESLLELEPHEGGFHLRTTVRTLHAHRVIITTGGKSYPGSGTTGDGYALAERLGHTIVRPRPALVPLLSAVDWTTELSGVTIPDVGVEVAERDDLGEPGCRPKVLASARGSFLFTHLGLSGPSVLDVSRAVTARPNPTELEVRCDFLPQTPRAQWIEQLRAAAAAAGKKQLASLLPEEVPQRLAQVLLARCQISLERKVAEISKRDWDRMAEALRCCRIPLRGTRGFEKAEVTAGGVTLDEVDSRRLESKLVPGLHFAGEVLDLDGPIGGYNFQAAWSTGYLAGDSV